MFGAIQAVTPTYIISVIPPDRGLIIAGIALALAGYLGWTAKGWRTLR